MDFKGNKVRCKVAILFFVLIITSILLPLFVLPTKATTPKFQSDKIENKYEHFEDVDPQNTEDMWDFAHPGYFSLDSFCKDGSNALMAHGPGGQSQDGVQYLKSFYDGSIEGWFYSKYSNYQYLKLWIRTNENTPSNNPTIDEGYYINLHIDKVVFGHRINGQGTKYITENIGYIANMWWRLKIAISGTMLTAEVESESGHIFKQYTHDISQDTDKLYYGRPAFSVCTSMGSTYKAFVDDVSISYQINDYNKDFEDGFLGSGWSKKSSTAFSVVSDYAYSGSNSLRIRGDDRIPYDGAQLVKIDAGSYHTYNPNFADGSISAYTRVLTSNQRACLWLRTSEHLDSKYTTTYYEGYVVCLYSTTAKIMRYSIGEFTVLDSVTIPSGRTDRWWYIRFEADGGLLRAYIEEISQDGFTCELFYDISNDDIKYTYGCAGISGSTYNLYNYPIYFDDINVKYAYTDYTFFSTDFSEDGPWCYFSGTISNRDYDLVEDANVELWIDNTKVLATTKTDANGEYEIDQIDYDPHINYKLKVYHPQHEKQIKNVKPKVRLSSIEYSITDFILDAEISAEKYAVIIGIKDFWHNLIIDDLGDDVYTLTIDMYKRLVFDYGYKDSQVYVYGDDHSDEYEFDYNSVHYDIWDDQATESKLKNKLDNLITNVADENDVISIFYVSHGVYFLSDYWFYCLDYWIWPFPPLFDHYISADYLIGLTDDSICDNIFIFGISCESGGMCEDYRGSSSTPVGVFNIANKAKDESLSYPRYDVFYKYWAHFENYFMSSVFVSPESIWKRLIYIMHYVDTWNDLHPNDPQHPDCFDGDSSYKISMI